MHKLIYNKTLLENTLIALKKIENIVIDENIIQELLDNIYEPFELDEDDLRANFRNYLDSLYPFSVYEEGEEEFFSQFDGIEVLPIELQDNFISFIDEREYIEAEKLFVSISKNRYKMHKDKITFFEYEGYKRVFPMIALHYDSEIGLTNDEVGDIVQRGGFL